MLILSKGNWERVFQTDALLWPSAAVSPAPGMYPLATSLGSTARHYAHVGPNANGVWCNLKSSPAELSTTGKPAPAT